MTNPVQTKTASAHRDVTPIEWQAGRLCLLDQSRLPHEVSYVHLSTAEETARAIREMRVRGAPAIGVTAAYGMALAAGQDGTTGGAAEAAADDPRSVAAHGRQPAVGHRAYDARGGAAPDGEDLAARLLAEASELHRETLESDHASERAGRSPDSARLVRAHALQHRRAGHRRIRHGARRDSPWAWEEGRVQHVFATETRPWLQGARLTTWELARLGIPATLVVDSAAASLMAGGRVQCVITGADRIAANGDTANKIGTLSLAVLASHYGVPFYVAAPVSTIDLGAASGEDIPIEERPEAEVTHAGSAAIAPEGTAAWNPAFDVTPGRLIAAIITDGGVARPPYEQSLAEVAGRG